MDLSHEKHELELSLVFLRGRETQTGHLTV